MCYTRRDQHMEEEARRIRVEDEARKRRQERYGRGEETKEEKPLTEKVKEMVGAR